MKSQLKSPEQQFSTLLKEFQYKLPISDTDLKRSFELVTCVNENEFYEFKCAICQYLVYEPKKCNTCVTIFCEACITKWMHQRGRQQGANCPTCRVSLGTSYSYADMIKINQILLNGCPFTGCTIRGQQITYIDLINHLRNECKFEQVHCISPQCDALFLPNESEDHFLKCNHLEHICEVCEIKIKGWEEFKAHNCTKVLKHKLKYANQTIEFLRRDIQQQLTKSLTYKKQIQIVTDERDELKNQIVTLNNQVDQMKTEMLNLNIQMNQQSEAIEFMKNNQKREMKKPLSVKNSLPFLPKLSQVQKMNLEEVGQGQKPFLMVNQRLFCSNHGIRLQKVNAKSHPNCICSFCNKKFIVLPKEIKVLDHMFLGYKCTLCVISVCQNCVSNNDFNKYIQ